MARFNAEAKYHKYHVMASSMCELLWIKHLVQGLQFGNLDKVMLKCDNLAVLYIASNNIFHERTKHIEIDCFIKEKSYVGPPP